MIRFVLLNGKRALDRWNQKELLQTPKNREAHNILNICHTRRASRVNSCAHKHQRAGPEPLAATPAQQHGHNSHFCCQENHPAQVNTVLPQKFDHIRLQNKNSESRHFELKCGWGRGWVFAIFFSFSLLSFGIMVFYFFPMWEG